MEKWVPTEKWDVERVAEYIVDTLFPENGSEQATAYKKIFVENAVDGAVLLTLTTEELKNDLQIAALGHRKRISSIIDELRQKDTQARKYSETVTIIEDEDTKNNKRSREAFESQHTEEFIDPSQERKRIRMAESQERRDLAFAMTFAPRACVICMEEIDIDFIYKLSGCGHDSFCRECMSSYLIDQVQSRNTCKCPIPDCKAEIARDDLEFLLEKKYIDLYEQFALESVIVKNPQNFLNCFTPGCDYVFFYDRDVDTDFQCPKCTKRYCLKCKVEYHSGSTCEQYQQWAIENGTTDDAFEEYKERSDGKNCPNCSNFIERTQGCSHMNCIVCLTRWCYECGKEQDECECNE